MINTETILVLLKLFASGSLLFLVHPIAMGKGREEIGIESSLCVRTWLGHACMIIVPTTND